MSLRVLMLTQWYDPEEGAAGHPGIVARAIRDHGHDVQVVTGFPTYPRGELFPGYRNRLYAKEIIDGITVHRGAIYPSHDARALRRSATYLSYAVTGSLASVRVPTGVDVVYVYSSPATTAIPGLVARTLRRAPVVLHIQDLWPDSVTASGFVEGGRVKRIEAALDRYCQFVYRHADVIAVSAPGMAALLRDRGVPAAKLHVLPNWADESRFMPVPRSDVLARQLDLLAPTVVMYAGNLGELQDLDTLLDAATILRDRTDIVVALVGSGVAEQRLRATVAARALKNVRILPTQPFDSIGSVLALGDAQVVSLSDAPVLRATLPSKLQANLAAGRPIIGAVRGDAAEVINATGSGLTTAPGDAVGLARTIERFAAMTQSERGAMAHAARDTYVQRFSKATVSEELNQLLHRTAGRDG